MTGKKVEDGSKDSGGESHGGRREDLHLSEGRKGIIVMPEGSAPKMDLTNMTPGGLPAPEPKQTTSPPAPSTEE